MPFYSIIGPQGLRAPSVGLKLCNTLKVCAWAEGVIRIVGMRMTADDNSRALAARRSIPDSLGRFLPIMIESPGDPSHRGDYGILSRRRRVSEPLQFYVVGPDNWGGKYNVWVVVEQLMSWEV